jgi:hypothetical protein
MYPYIPSLTLDTVHFSQIKFEQTELDTVHLVVR